MSASEPSGPLVEFLLEPCLLSARDTSVWAFSVFVVRTKIMCADEFVIIQV